MFYYFLFKREEFLEHYHRRSNVESAFSAVKRKLGDAVRGKNDRALLQAACLHHGQVSSSPKL